MALATLIGCGTMIWAGKREHNWGDSISKQNRRWHRQHTDEKHHAHDHDHHIEDKAKTTS
jgi:hypothetical protein